MSLIFHLLIATLLIAGLILLRMFVYRYTLQTRIRGSHADSECEQVGCFRGCDQHDGAAPDDDPVAGQSIRTR
jgi:hypothetical protein